MAQAHLPALRVGEQLQEAHDIVEVVERLPDAHEHQSADRHSGVPLCLVDLAEHLGGGQVPHEARDRRCAEAAAHFTAYLCGDT